MDELNLASLLTDPKTKDLFEDPSSPECRAMLLKKFGSKFTPEQCQKRVAIFSPSPPEVAPCNLTPFRPPPLPLFALREMNVQTLRCSTDFVSKCVPGA